MTIILFLVFGVAIFFVVVSAWSKGSEAALRYINIVLSKNGYDIRFARNKWNLGYRFYMHPGRAAELRRRVDLMRVEPPERRAGL
jgi:hypothetical protein